MNYFPCIKCKNDFSFKGEELLFPLKKTMLSYGYVPLRVCKCEKNHLKTYKLELQTSTSEV